MSFLLTPNRNHQIDCLYLGHVFFLTSDYIRKKLGDHIFDSVNEYRLSNFLAQEEDAHRMVLYQCDNTLTAWTMRCLRQADVLLLLALSHKKPAVEKVC